MSEENEVKSESGDVYNEYDNSVNHAVNLWPLAVIGIAAALVVVSLNFLPNFEKRAQMIPWGKSFTAVGNVVDCQQVSTPVSPWNTAKGPYRSFIRTPKDEIFSIYWRQDFQAPVFGAAIGELKYHQCGVQDSVSVYCFDSFAVSKERVKVLDLGPVKP